MDRETIEGILETLDFRNRMSICYNDLSMIRDQIKIVLGSVAEDQEEFPLIERLVSTLHQLASEAEYLYVGLASLSEEVYGEYEDRR